MEFYPKLYVFNTPVQKEGTLPGFHIHTVGNSPWSFFWAKIHLEVNTFYLLLLSLQFNLHVQFQRILEGHNSSRMRISWQIKGSKERFFEDPTKLKKLLVPELNKYLKHHRLEKHLTRHWLLQNESWRNWSATNTIERNWDEAENELLSDSDTEQR